MKESLEERKKRLRSEINFAEQQLEQYWKNDIAPFIPDRRYALTSPTSIAKQVGEAAHVLQSETPMVSKAIHLFPLVANLYHLFNKN